MLPKLIVIVFILAGLGAGLTLIRNPQVFSPKASQDFGAQAANLVPVYVNGRVAFNFFRNQIPGTVPVYRLSSNRNRVTSYDGLGYVFYTTNQALIEPMTRPIYSPGDESDAPRTYSKWYYNNEVFYAYPSTISPRPQGAAPVSTLRQVGTEAYVVYLANQEEIQRYLSQAAGRAWVNLGVAFYAAPGTTAALPSATAAPSLAPDPWRLQLRAGQNSCRDNAGYVEVLWNQLRDVPGLSYKIYRKDTPTGSFQLKETSNNLYHAARGLSSNTAYSFKLEVFSNNRPYQEQVLNITTTNCGSATPTITPSPSPVSRPTSAPSPATSAFSLTKPVASCLGSNNPNIRLDWTAVPGVSSYTVLYRDQSSGQERKIITTDSRSFNFGKGDGLVSGRSYGFLIAAYPSSGTVYSNGMWSDQYPGSGWVTAPACP